MYITKVVEELFDFGTYHTEHDGFHMFFNIVLKIPFGNFPIGHIFNRANIDGRNMSITFFNSNGNFVPLNEHYRFQLSLSYKGE